MKTALCSVLVCVLLVGAPAQAGDPLVWEPRDNKVVGVFNTAIDLLNGGQLGQAEARFRRALKIQDDFGPALIALGETLYRLDRPGEAIPLYERVVADAPKHTEVLGPLAWALFGAQRFEESQGVAARAVEALPADESGWQALVMAELRLGTYPRIEERLAKVRAVKDTPALACFAAQVFLEMERVDDAKLAMMVCRDVENEALLHNSEAALSAVLGDDADLTAWAEEVGDDASTAYSRAIEAFNEGRFDEVEALASRSIKLGYPTPAALLLRAHARYEMGKPAAARRDLKEVLGDDGSWLRVSERGALVGVLTKTQEIDLTKRMRFGAVILVLLHAEGGDLDRAAQAVVDARTAFGAYSSLLAAEALIFQARGEDGKAWSMLAHALRQEPDLALYRIAGTLVASSAATATDEAVAAVAERGSPTLAYNLAVGSAKAGLQGRCVTLVRALVAEPQPAESPLWTQDRARLRSQSLGLGYDCAVRQPDLQAAERLGEDAGWAALPAWAAVYHGDQLYDAKQPDAVLAHLERCKSTEGEQADWAVDLIVRVHLDGEDLDAVLVWARHGSAGPVTRYNAGTALAVAERNLDAKELLEAACPELEGDVAKACLTNLEIVNEVLAE